MANKNKITRHRRELSWIAFAPRAPDYQTAGLSESAHLEAALTTNMKEHMMWRIMSGASIWLPRDPAWRSKTLNISIAEAIQTNGAIVYVEARTCGRT